MGFLRMLLKVLLGFVAIVIVVVGLFLFSAGFSDGPLAIVPGGVFTSGELVTEEPECVSLDHNRPKGAADDTADGRGPGHAGYQDPGQERDQHTGH